MGAGANDRCLIDAEEMIDDRSVERAVFEFPFLHQLLIMQTKKSGKEFQESSGWPIFQSLSSWREGPCRKEMRNGN